ncbi:ATP-binding protein [Gemmatimonas sp.]|uniref:ATP-binding protein n=1 Tax=Gemmatimonas sp. TaxID=1962908 RepID=UPI00286DBDEF|nr:ATP-binding protein [Gemmatimonas sp.]
MSPRAPRPRETEARPPALPPAAPPDLDAMLKRLHLPTIRRLHAELAVQAEAEGMGYRAYLDTLVAEEIAHRAFRRYARSTISTLRFNRPCGGRCSAAISASSW